MWNNTFFLQLEHFRKLTLLYKLLWKYKSDFFSRLTVPCCCKAPSGDSTQLQLLPARAFGTDSSKISIICGNLILFVGFGLTEKQIPTLFCCSIPMPGDWRHFSETTNTYIEFFFCHSVGQSEKCCGLLTYLLLIGSLLVMKKRSLSGIFLMKEMRKSLSHMHIYVL